MILGITSIQRNRGPYILEWIAFHMCIGFNRFYIYNHGNDPVQRDILTRLANAYKESIFCFNISTDVSRPQIAAYQHSWSENINKVDGMAFIDGDEFLFSPGKDFPGLLKNHFSNKLSALGVYWVNYGSNGFIAEPTGLVIENYTRHSSASFVPNRHIKTILKGGERADIQHSHLFSTELGTYDENYRLITKPFMPSTPISIESFRINHYATQAYEYYYNKKRTSGQADMNSSSQFERSINWFHEYDRNECDDGTIYNYITRTKLKLLELENAINDPSTGN